MVVFEFSITRVLGIFMFPASKMTERILFSFRIFGIKTQWMGYVIFSFFDRADLIFVALIQKNSFEFDSENLNILKNQILLAFKN